MGFWAWVALVGLIAAPVVESLVNTGALPSGVGAVFSTLGTWFASLWGWLSQEVGTPRWLLVVVIAGGLVFAAIGIWLIWPSASNAPAQKSRISSLPEDQQRVFLLVGHAANQGGNVHLDQVMRNLSLSRLAAEHALEQLSSRDLIDWVYNPYGADYYGLTSLGRGCYLQHERAAQS